VECRTTAIVERGGRVTPRVGNDDLSGVIRAALVLPGHRQKLSTQAAAAAAAAWMDRYWA